MTNFTIKNDHKQKIKPLTKYLIIFLLFLIDKKQKKRYTISSIANF